MIMMIIVTIIIISNDIIIIIRVIAVIWLVRFCYAFRHAPL